MTDGKADIAAGGLSITAEDGTYQTLYRKWFGSDEHASADHS